MSSLLRFFLSLSLIGVGDSFSPLRNVSPINAAKNVDNLSLTQVHARTNTNNGNRRYGHQSKKSNGSTPKRVPQNKRTAIRWVVQGVERCLAEEGPGNKNEGKTYKRRIDASLVDALYLMVNANDQKDVLDAEKRVQGLMTNPSNFPLEVNERVIKATAMAGLTYLSSTLMKTLIHKKNGTIPSPMAYTAVLNALRKNGRIDRLEETLTDLASASRRLKQETGEETAIDIVAFNTYLAALCDAAVNELPFVSTTIDDAELGFNFTTLEPGPSKITSSSEKYLYKALNLVRGDTARTKFNLGTDPDIYSYNSILNAAAKCSKSDVEDHFTKPIIESLMRGMLKRGIDADIFTYNSRIQAALALGEDENTIQLIDQVLSNHSVELDRYTINLMLKPFIKADRRDEIWSIVREFYEKNVGSNGRIISPAFEAMLNTIVQTGEIDFAREIFQAFFLPPKLRSHRGLQISDEEVQRQESASTESEAMQYYRGPIEQRSRPSPRTRHFNILFGGYSKSLRQGKSSVSTANQNGTPNELDDVTNIITVPDNQGVYDLLDAMVSLGVPLDACSVTSLMALPFLVSEDIMALLVRIEPEMMVELNPAAYRSTINAFGKAGDPSSACWMFEEMHASCRNQGKHLDNWNVMLGALNKGCAGADTGEDLHILKSTAARARSHAGDDAGNQFISVIDGKTCVDASMTILDAMRYGTGLPDGYTAPKPNSQTYCLVVSSIYGSGTSESNPDLSLDLFRDAMKEGVAADGRFLNAVLRCFGDDIEGALTAWKSEIGPAAAAYERMIKKRGTNLVAAYNGLMHVCGRAIRPDVATRIAYAMQKAGVEPTEVTLNSYHAGKRVALDGNDDGKNSGLRNQYESILAVECTKYNDKDKRRAKDRKIRIIF